MANCPTSGNYIGRKVIVEYVESCGTVDPETLTYKPIGSLNQKDISLGTVTTDNTTDDTAGVQSSLVTYLTFSATVAGLATSKDTILANQASLLKYMVNEVIAGRQPTVTVRIICPDVTYYAFCNVTESSKGMPSGESVSFSVTFTATGTPPESGINSVIIVDTPEI